MTHWLVVGAAGNTGRFWMAALGGAHWPVTGLIRPRQRDQFLNLQHMRIDWHHPFGSDTTDMIRDLHFIDSLAILSRHYRYNVVLAVKSAAIAVAFEEVRLALGQQLGLVFIPTNGLYGEHHATCQLRDTKGIVSTTLTYPCESGDKPDIIRVGNADRGICFAALHQHDQSDVQALATDLFERNPHIQTAVYGDWRPMKWTKLLLNLMGNVIPAILNRELEVVYQNPTMCRLEMLAIDEIAHLINWLGFKLVGLPGYPLEKIQQLVQLAHLEHWFGWSGQPAKIFAQKIVPKILAGRGGKLPSLLVSLRRKRDGASLENLAREAMTSAFSTTEHSLYPILSTLGTLLEQRWEDSDERLSTVTPENLWAAYQQRVNLISRSLKWRLRRALP